MRVQVSDPNWEWRIAYLERQDVDKEKRLRELESRLDVFSTKLDTLAEDTLEIKAVVKLWEHDRYKNLWGFLVTVVAIVATGLVEHFVR